MLDLLIRLLWLIPIGFALLFMLWAFWNFTRMSNKH
jgi:hypothetical protein